MKVSSLLFNCLFAFIFPFCSSYCLFCVKSLTPFLIEALPNPRWVIFNLTKKKLLNKIIISVPENWKRRIVGINIEVDYLKIQQQWTKKTNLFHIHFSQWQGQINKRQFPCKYSSTFLLAPAISWKLSLLFLWVASFLSKSLSSFELPTLVLNPISFWR